jgi:putative methyltransferase (TIGR04325 family)
MNMENFRSLTKKILPPFVSKHLSGIYFGWHGNYPSWHSAREKCTGYDSEKILDKVRTSLLQVKNGNALYERDSVLFNTLQYSYPLLSGLMWIAARNKGKLNVLDFGGSLGSSYFQNKRFMDSLKDINWCIVEQPAFVRTGIEDFATDKLHFFNTIDDCLKSFRIDVVLFSSVLQYLEEPFKVIEQVKSMHIENIIIDRTPFISGKDRITIQKVRPRIYKASYPCWFFNKEKFVSLLTKDYEMILEFDALDEANISSEFKGFILKRLDQ